MNQQSLFGIAQQIGLGAQLLLGEGELKSGGAQRPSILADALEALIGAAFLDGGFDAAYAMVLHLFARQLRDSRSAERAKDAKTLLQEYLQSAADRAAAVFGDRHRGRGARAEFSRRMRDPGAEYSHAGRGSEPAQRRAGGGAYGL